MKKLTLTLFPMILVGCGLAEKPQDCKTNPETYTNCPQPTQEVIKTTFSVRGAVSSAFGIVVDGVAYSDIEEFYTLAAANLDASVAELGLEGYTAVFQKADLGINSLTRDMNVYIQANSNRGYAAKTQVSSDNTFKVSFPLDAAGDTYEIRAVKKIKVVASKEVTTILEDGTEETEVDAQVLCWNFSAVEHGVDYADVDTPVILSTFETKLTTKDCTVDNTGVFGVPK